MRTQQLLALSGLLLASNVAIASKLDHDDVPNRCWEACGSVVNTAQRCDHQHDDDDSAEMKCICDWDAAKTQIPLCAACIDKYDRDYDTDDDDDDDDDDNEALEIVHKCNFSTTTYNSAAATSTGSSTSTGSAATATTTNASSTSSSSTDTASGSGSSSNSDNGNGSATNTDTNGGDSTQEADSATTSNAAPGMNAPGALSMAALAGLMPLAWL